MKTWKILNEEFLSQKEAEDFCELLGIPTDGIQEIEKESLNEAVPDPESEITGLELEALKYQKQGFTSDEAKQLVMLKHYDEIGNDAEAESLKKTVLSKTLGASTGHDKNFTEHIPVEEAEKTAYQKVWERINDPTDEACPICGLHMSQLAFYKGLHETLAKQGVLKGTTQTVGMMKSIPMMKPETKVKVKITHIKSRHESLYKLLEKTFNPWKTGDTGLVSTEKEGIENLAELSNEELAARINSSPELRHRFFREWLRRLQQGK